MQKPRIKRSPFLEIIDHNDLEVDIFYFVSPKGNCPVEDFLNDLKKVSKKKKAKLGALILRYAKESEIINDKRCRRLKGRVREFWEFKDFQHRLFFFKEGAIRIIITHGFVKKADDLSPDEEDRMLSIREIYNNLNLYK